jgi:hypothetical protein
MNKTNYKPLFEKFIQEVINTNNPSFINMEGWTLADDLLNGVEIPYTIKQRPARELIHQIGLKYGLIPLCPDEVVDIDVSDDNKPIRSFVRTLFGEMTISPKTG